MREETKRQTDRQTERERKALQPPTPFIFPSRCQSLMRAEIVKEITNTKKKKKKNNQADANRAKPFFFEFPFFIVERKLRLKDAVKRKIGKYQNSM